GHEGPGSVVFTSKRSIHLEFGRFEQRSSKLPAEDFTFPIQSRLLGFPAPVVSALRMLWEKVQVPCKKIKDFLVPKPTGSLAVDFEGARIKVQEMGAVFEGRDVRVRGFPVVGNDDQPAGGRKFVRNAPDFQRARVGQPRERFYELCLA